MSDDRDHDPWARRRPEPEIIPPGRPDPRGPGEARVFMSFADARGRRVYLGRPSPLAIILGLLGLGVFAAAALVLFLGLFLLWIPVAGLLIGGAIIGTLLRGSLRRLP